MSAIANGLRKIGSVARTLTADMFNDVVAAITGDFVPNKIRDDSESSTLSDNEQNLGAPNNRWKNLYLGGRILQVDDSGSVISRDETNNPSGGTFAYGVRGIAVPAWIQRGVGKENSTSSEQYLRLSGQNVEVGGSPQNPFVVRFESGDVTMDSRISIPVPSHNNAFNYNYHAVYMRPDGSVFLYTTNETSPSIQGLLVVSRAVQQTDSLTVAGGYPANPDNGQRVYCWPNARFEIYNSDNSAWEKDDVCLLGDVNSVQGNFGVSTTYSLEFLLAFAKTVMYNPGNKRLTRTGIRSTTGTGSFSGFYNGSALDITEFSIGNGSAPSSQFVIFA